MPKDILLYLGLILFVTGIGAYLNPHFFRKILGNYTQSPALVYLNGFINAAVGFYLIANHNVWVLDWPLVITIIGWVAVIRGIWILLAPENYIKSFKQIWSSQGHVRGEALFMILFGILLMYVSKIILQ